MTTSLVTPSVQDGLLGTSLRQQIDSTIEELIIALPDPKQLTAEQRRGMIARYTAVLEGNFIYWMTATYLSVKATDARPILLDNLHEEVRDCHPAMLRNFTMAAHAFPTDRDALDVHNDLTNVRLFLGQPALHGLVTLENRRPHRVLLLVGIERETDCRGVGRGDTAYDRGHR